MHRFAWNDGSVEFHLPHGEMLRLLRNSGFEVEDLIEVQIPEGATTRSPYVSPEWAPDGKYIVASKSGALFGMAKLWMYHVDGGNGVALTSQPAAPPQIKMIGAAFGKDPRFLWFAARQGDWQAARQANRAS